MIEIAREVKKVTEEGRNINLTEEELAFYDLLASKEKFFENYEEIKQVAQEIVKELGYYVRVADWNKKDYMKAKIRAAIKKILLKRINKNVSYNIVNNLSNEIVTQAEMVYGGV